MTVAVINGTWDSIFTNGLRTYETIQNAVHFSLQ